MAIRIIRQEGDPVLREVAKPVREITKNILKLLDDMAETMYDAEGVGLAAPQVGISKRVIVMDVGEGLIELINPVIVLKEGEQTGPEGCLSIPGLTAEVTRANRVVAKGLNRHGEEITIEGQELLARCIQHEIDHLDGILFIDYVNPLNRLKSKK
ncbi:peptide deformylase [Effusibacillus dendaii]|uniref:Peptide deformylase n=1 Tax=Effusibacillus dendaii TaxID=2743772 RepID=A0A7I8D4S6_9BACL|nr:peptide deformylase [Effusibacillus dendaii]BCJ85123.1 peptide deformylase [Effusibacillus dendaii]